MLFFLYFPYNMLEILKNIYLEQFTDAEEAQAAAEERKRIRKLRSRRDRCKNGAQFTQNLYPDFRQVERFVQQGTNGSNGTGNTNC